MIKILANEWDVIPISQSSYSELPNDILTTSTTSGSSFFTRNSIYYLSQNSLVLASVTHVPSEAITKTGVVVTKSTSRTITSLWCSITSHYIISRRTFFLWTVWTTVSNIAFAANVFFCIPWGIVSCWSINRKSLLSKTNSFARTIVRAQCSFTSHSIIIIKAITFSSCTVALSLVRTFHWWVTFVCPNRFCSPCVTIRAGSERAIMTNPCWNISWSKVTCALVFFYTNDVTKR